MAQSPEQLAVDKVEKAKFMKAWLAQKAKGEQIDDSISQKIANIPIAPGITIDTLLDFKGDCVEPAALQVITEALDYALEVSVSRLTSLGKIFHQVEASAYGMDQSGILPTIKAIRIALNNAPLCEPSVELGDIPPLPPPLPAKEKTKVEPVKAEVKTEPAKTTDAEKKAVAAIAQIKSLQSPELVQAMKANPELAKAVAAATQAQIAKPTIVKPATVKPAIVKPPAKPKKKVKASPYWGPAIFHGVGEEAHLSGEYITPTALAEALNLETKARKAEGGRESTYKTKDIPKLFELAGFKVTANGEGKPEKIQGDEEGSKFHVRRIGPTPDRWKKEVTQTPASKKRTQAKEAKVEEVGEPNPEPEWIPVQIGGITVARDLVEDNPKSSNYGLIKKGSREWFNRRYTVFFDQEGIALGTSEGAEAYTGPSHTSEAMILPAGPNKITGQSFAELKKIAKQVGGE